jgi:hypothetical protein
MERITRSQIRDFNNPLAFARDREARLGQVAVESSSSRNFKTSNREASFRLVTGAVKRLETMKSNLEMMLELSKTGRSTRTGTLKHEEIYGKLRSLSAGFDQVVESVRFDGNPIFGGNKLSLNMGSGSRPMTLEASKLFTFGEDSLNLSTSKETAEITIFETVDDAILNQNSNPTGVSLGGASLIEGSNSALELDNTSYKVKILFTGNGSAVEILDRFGSLVERQENVDLSGEGREFVDFDVGVRLQIDKNPVIDALDDLDFNLDDPIELNSSILYRRLDSHTLRNDGSETAVPDGASLLFSPSLGNAESGRLNVSDPKLTPPSENTEAFESGYYTMDIQYRGENSYIRLTDALGRIRGFKFDVDLREENTTVNFNGGLSVNIDNTGFAENGSLQASIELNRTPPAIDEFDFRKYSTQIEDALALINEELTKMEDTAIKIQELNAQRNPWAQANMATTASLRASSSLNILAGGANGPLSILNSNTSQRFAQAANQIFSTTTALPTQANQNPEQLASLRQASAANILSGA